MVSVLVQKNVWFFPKWPASFSHLASMNILWFSWGWITIQSAIAYGRSKQTPQHSSFACGLLQSVYALKVWDVLGVCFVYSILLLLWRSPCLKAVSWEQYFPGMTIMLRINAEYNGYNKVATLGKCWRHLQYSQMSWLAHKGKPKLTKKNQAGHTKC